MDRQRIGKRLCGVRAEFDIALQQEAAHIPGKPPFHSEASHIDAVTTGFACCRENQRW
jgi:hypothetical protein